MKMAMVVLGGVFAVIASGCAHQKDVACKENTSSFSFPGFRTHEAKNKYKHTKCIEGRAKYSELLSYAEICEYSNACHHGAEGKKVEMYCDQADISQCFESKAWVTVNEFVGLPRDVKVGSVMEQHVYKNGVNSSSTCVYY